MPSFDPQVAQFFERASYSRERVTGRTGYPSSTVDDYGNPVYSNPLGTGNTTIRRPYIYVTLSNGRGTVRAINAFGVNDTIGGIPVELERNLADEWQIIGIDGSRAPQELGGATLGVIQAPLPADFNTQVVAGRNIEDLRLRAEDGEDTLYVTVNPGAHQGGYFPGADLALTDVESGLSTGERKWALVYLDVTAEYQSGSPYTGTLGYVASSAVYYGTDSLVPISIATDLLTSLTSGQMPLGAVVIYEGMTAITASSRFLDLRHHFDLTGSYEPQFFRQSSELTIASGVVTVTQTHHGIDTQSDAASDDLDTINGFRAVGEQHLFIRAENTARTVVVKHNTGNILLAGSGDISLDDTNKFIHLLYDNTQDKWVQVGVNSGATLFSTANVSNPPTDAELDTAFGTPASVGNRFVTILDDNNADANVWLVVSNGTSWHYVALTKAV